MSPVDGVVGWFADPTHWTGATGVPTRLLEHLGYSGLAVLIGLAIAVPLGALVGHTGRGGFLVVGTANSVRALPDFGLLLLLALLLGIGLLPAVIVLAILAIPPLLAGTYAGIRNVDRATVDAATGMGMNGPQVLWKVELPNALPLMFGGLRSAVLQVIATTAIAAFIGLGGLGRFLIDGLRARDYPEMAAGALLVAALALLVEGVLALVERLTVSRGLRRPPRRPGRTARPASPEPRPRAAAASRTPDLAGADR